MTFSKWVSIGTMLFALGTTTALAGDATADRASRQDRRATAQVEARRDAAPVQQGSGGDDCHRKDCCAMSAKPAASAAQFTDMG